MVTNAHRTDLLVRFPTVPTNPSCHCRGRADRTLLDDLCFQRLAELQRACDIVSAAIISSADAAELACDWFSFGGSD